MTDKDIEGVAKLHIKINELEKELETWKKIAEKLAENFIDVEYYSNDVGKLIDWARNEVEK